MKTLHKTCAGLDVHKARWWPVCALLQRKVEREVRRFPTTTQGLLALAEWLESADARGDGSDGRVLEAGLAHFGGASRSFWRMPRM